VNGATSSPDRICTTHVGSLPRPENLLAVMHGHTGSAADDQALADGLGIAVRAIVHRQVAIGLDFVSDGEMSKPSYATYVTDRLDGFSGKFEGHTAQDLRDYQGFARRLVEIGAVVPDAGGACCTGPVSMPSLDALNADLENFRTAVDATPPVGAFMNAASPGVIAVFQRNDFYPDDAAYLEAVADAMRAEYEAIVEAGFMLQIDCPDLAMGRHLAFSNLADEEFLKIAARNVEALNAAVANIPPEKMRMHVCWGNYAGPHHRDIPLERIIDIVLGARPAYLLIEGANPRHAHEWSVFERVELPEDKILVPGVVDSTSNFIEHPDLVAQRICRYADLVGRQRVMASTDCGFSTFRDHPTVHPDIAWAKLRSLVEGAAVASERLWRAR
jgi:5-methyltetrahydropteroyltriglutamate--homocysteine methyltransferase